MSGRRVDIERIDAGVDRRPLHSVEATRRVEAEALAARPTFELMARAGDAVARLALALAPHARRVVVFAGLGNNGGDGLVAAARLTAIGKRVEVVHVADAGRLPADAARALAQAMAAGVPIRPADSAGNGSPAASAGGTGAPAASTGGGGSHAAANGAAGPPPDLVIDALLGIGGGRRVEGALAAAIARIDEHARRGAHVLAVDVPSGLDAERGRPLGDADDDRAVAVRAHDTLSLLTLKAGLFTGAGRDHAGAVWFADLGVDRDARAERASSWLVGRRDETLRVAARTQAAHKGSFGDVGVVGGASGMTGAAWLAARAALAAGAGRVFVELLDPAAGVALDPARPELMVRPAWSAGPVETLARATVVCGCGGGDAVRAVLPRLLSTVRRLVLDADALNAIAADPSLLSLVQARAARGASTIATPHPLEAARLLEATTSAVQGDRLLAASELARRLRAVVVLKGSGSVIAAPDERLRVCATGDASLASAGTGDVLAGWLGGRWSAEPGLAALDAATRAVVEHGAAADPSRAGAWRAADLVDALHARARGDALRTVVRP